MTDEEYKKLKDFREVKIPFKDKGTVFRKEVIYDIHSLPFFDNPASYKAAVDSVLDIYNKSGILLYDSSKGKAPIFTEKELKR